MDAAVETVAGSGAESGAVAALARVSHRYGKTAALDDVTLALPAGRVVGLIGPDGVGKSTLLGLIAGARRIQAGTVRVLGGDMADARHRNDVCPAIAYMPQGLGRNLYPDLSVRENIAFFARMFGQARAERDRRTDALLDRTGLAPFGDRPAKKLSGGMRQKLGLCCALIHDPDLLILDEPTTGVDPLSRRQFWELIGGMHAQRPAMSVVIATAYMEEAARFDWLVAMDGGKLLATGTPQDLIRRTGAANLEDAFVALLPAARSAGHQAFVVPPRTVHDGPPVIVARELTRRFGDFKAVDRVSFTIERGEIFGFVGSNGCGKTTTRKMLTGLLPPSEGSALLFGQPVSAGDIAARRRVGYMSQSFSLYTELTVSQNLLLHARLFQLPAGRVKPRIAELVGQCGLGAHLEQKAGDLPLGIRQRLSLAVAVIHEPEMLILDEPTSGVDPLARDRFWALLVDLSRRQGVTIFVSTHFMNEATRCDRVALMDAGQVLATGTPVELVAARGAATLEDAFVDYLAARAGASAGASVGHAGAGASIGRAAPIVGERAPGAPLPPSSAFSLRRLTAFTIREGLEALRDPIRLAFALFGTVFLLFLFGAGITADVDHLTYAALDRDNTPESRAYLEEFRGSSYFVERPPVGDYEDFAARMKSGELRLVIELPPNFGRDVKKGAPAEVAAWIDGAMPFRAETIRGYAEGVHTHYLADLAAERQGEQRNDRAAPAPATIETRFRYNQSFDSVYAMVPNSIALLLVLIPGILMALAIVREKELGPITNLYVTPATRLEFLLGKQLPYIAIAMLNFAAMFLVATLFFQVPLKGSFAALLLGALLYVTTSTSLGMLVSAFTRTQIAALFGTAILTSVIGTQFSGMLTPVSTLQGAPWVMGHIFPMTYFLRVIVGAFTKGLGFAELAGSLAALALFIPALLALSHLLLSSQER
ncbi:MAG TPA: ribosome-associated ATPase/putative transporter RbbA [Candidatus Sulfotelmatobacter sp.]|nr:ribosome-associated ATPase/putative transporter RbbA [Candidatus Sulfotelmatobacter sp.]